MRPESKLITSRSEQGFSLVEVLMSLLLMMAVLGVAVKGITEMQRRSFAEGSKVDTVQQTRDFIDQVVRDIHNVAYPPGKVMAGNPTCVNNPAVSCGLILFSSTQIRYEGDLDGSGTVYQVWLQLVPNANGCPCTLQRGVITKAQAIAGTAPTYFTEVNGVLNSGNGAGAATFPINLGGAVNYVPYSTADAFVAYDMNAAQVGACGDPVTCSSIRSLQIGVNVAPNFADPTTKIFPVYSITSKARLNNIPF